MTLEFKDCIHATGLNNECEIASAINGSEPKTEIFVLLLAQGLYQNTKNKPRLPLPLATNGICDKSAECKYYCPGWQNNR